jgi:WD40 repeat protein
MSQFILATGGYESTVRIFDAQNASLLRTIQFSDSQVLQLAFSGVGPVAYDAPLTLAVAGSPRISLYDVSARSSSTNPTFVFEGHTGPVTSVGFHPSNPPLFVYSASEDKTLQVWDPQVSPPAASGHASAHSQQLQTATVRSTSACVIAKFENKYPINAAVFYEPGELFFTADTRGLIRIWSLKSGKASDNACGEALGEASPHPTNRHLQTLELSSDNTRLVSANADGKVFVYEVSDLLADPRLPPLSTFQAVDEKAYITRTRLSMDCSKLACTLSTGVVTVFHMEDVICRHAEERKDQYGRVDSTVQPCRRFRGHVGWVWDAVFVGEQSNYLFTCSTNTHVILWNLDEEHSSTNYPGHTKAVVCLAIVEQYQADPQMAPQGQFAAP